MELRTMRLLMLAVVLVTANAQVGKKCPPALASLSLLGLFRANNICGVIGGLGPARQCSTIALIRRELQGTAESGSSLKCLFTQTPVPGTFAGKQVPAPLANRRPLPAGSFPNTAAVFAQEGPTYAWHYQNLLNMYIFTQCAANKTRFLVPAGWSLPPGGIISIQEEPRPVAPIPVALVMTNRASSTLVVIMRGTLTGYEWEQNIKTGQVNSTLFPGATHEGFTGWFKQIWEGGVKAALDSQVLAGPKLAHVQISGHSLGAATAQLMAYAAQSYLNQKLKGTGRSVVVDAMLFAPPTVGTPAFAEAFNKLVNARRIVFDADLVPQIPCASMPECSNTTAVGQYSFSAVGGTLMMTPEGMPVQQEAWSGFNRFDPCRATVTAAATHTCAYMCFLSRFSTTTNTRCLLWPATAEAAADNTYCPGYPTQAGTRPFPLPLVG